MTHSHDTATPALSVESGEGIVMVACGQCQGIGCDFCDGFGHFNRPVRGDEPEEKGQGWITLGSGGILKGTRLRRVAEIWRDQGLGVVALPVVIPVGLLDVLRPIAEGAAPAPNPSPAAKGGEAEAVAIGSPEWCDEAERSEWAFMAKMLGAAIDYIRPANLSGLGVAKGIAEAHAKKGWRTYATLATPSPQPADAAREARAGIYTASKTKHAPVWQDYRARGWPINSTWIDEAGPGESADLSDLWDRCIREASTAAVLVVYREDEDVLKGGWAEVGAALACGVPVYAVGIEGFTIAKDRRIKHFETLEDAMDAAAHLAAFSARFQAICNTPESRALAALCAPRAALASDPAPAGEAVEPVAYAPKRHIGRYLTSRPKGVGACWVYNHPTAEDDDKLYLHPAPEDTARLREDLERESKESYEIGKRDGYEEAVQHIDQRTGGDGEYCCVVGHDADDRHCPDPQTMIARIVERFEALDGQTNAANRERDDAVKALKTAREALKPFAAIPIPCWNVPDGYPDPRLWISHLAAARSASSQGGE